MRRRIPANDCRSIPARSGRHVISTRQWMTVRAFGCSRCTRAVQLLTLCTSSRGSLRNCRSRSSASRQTGGENFSPIRFSTGFGNTGSNFRPVKPASPHLNGKVERSQRTDIEEFYSGVDLKAADLDAQLLQWQDHYNHFRPHGSLNGLTPWEKWHALVGVTPCWDEVEAKYDPAMERIRHPDYRIDSRLSALEKQRGKRLS